MSFETVKALHIIFVITWFAGLFYMVRLFVYQTEANQKTEPERTILLSAYKRHQRPLWYGITWPSMIGTLVFGTWTVLFNYAFYLSSLWFHLKLGLVILLIAYQFHCHYVFRKLQNDIYKYTPFGLRLLNEIPTILLVAVVFLVVSKPFKNWFLFCVGLGIFAIIILGAIYLNKQLREKKLAKEKPSDGSTS
jgi:protoporphyrinogen IX oxidase